MKVGSIDVTLDKIVLGAGFDRAKGDRLVLPTRSR